MEKRDGLSVWNLFGYFKGTVHQVSNATFSCSGMVTLIVYFRVYILRTKKYA